VRMTHGAWGCSSRLLTPTMMLPDVTVTITADGSTPARPAPIVIVVFIVVRTLGGEGGAFVHWDDGQGAVHDDVGLTEMMVRELYMMMLGVRVTLGGAAGVWAVGEGRGGDPEAAAVAPG
jgi:hypothetical protein